MISQADFIHLVRDELRLPLADPDLEHDFDQEVNWRSIQRVRLFAAMEQRTGRKVPVSTLFEERTVRGIYSVFAEPPGEGRAGSAAAGSIAGSTAGSTTGSTAGSAAAGSGEKREA